MARVLALSKPSAANSESAVSRMRRQVFSPRCLAPGRYRLAGTGMESSWGGAHLYLSVDIVNQLIQFMPTIRLAGQSTFP
jgi:hypothetical protein